LANQMVRLSGLIPEQDIKIVFVGLRPGEKMHEELLTRDENTIPTHHPKIKIARVDKLNDKVLLPKIDSLLKDYYAMSKRELVKYFRNIVPEYKSTNDEYNGKAGRKPSAKTGKAKEKVV
jgi:FlaA1/EpsC-like NDP-sugar epimerase